MNGKLYIVLPSDLVMLRISANFALKVDIVVFFDVIGVQSISQLQLNVWWNWEIHDSLVKNFKLICFNLLSTYTRRST